MAKASGKIFLAGEDLDWTQRKCLMYALPIYTKVDISPASDVILRQKGTEHLISNLTSFTYTADFNDYVTAALHLWDAEVCPVENILIDITSMIPVSAGLGSSAAVLNALFGALVDYYHIQDPIDICKFGYRTEHDLIGSVVGTVDFYISQSSGLMLYDNHNDTVSISFLDDILKDVDIALIYTGNDSNTAEVNREKFKRYEAREPDFMTYLDRTEELVVEGAKAVEAHNLASLGTVVSKAHHLMSRFLKNSTDQIDAIVQLANDFGAYGSKLTGCGHGGYVFSIIDKKNAIELCEELNDRRIKYMRIQL